MPSKEWNKEIWGATYDWHQAGDEWSSSWGNAEAQWYGSLYPRFHRYLAGGHVLEIGPGYGRWTQFLLNYCDSIDLVDLSSNCIDACKKRFQSFSNISYHVNDGTSLSMIPDESIDLVFSFDSLVHAEADVIEGYLAEIAKKLSVNGIGIIHHSNLGQYLYFKVLRAIENTVKPKNSITQKDLKPGNVNKLNSNISHLKNNLTNFLIYTRLLDRTHMRALSVTAKLFRRILKNNGLHCISQEIVCWGSSTRLIDCISIFTRENSVRRSNCEVIRNPKFMREADYIKKLATLYCK